MTASTNTVTVDSIARRRKSRRVRGWIIWLLIACLIGASGYWFVALRQVKSTAVHYTTSAVMTGDITVIVTAVGTVEPIEQVEVGSLISGTIAQVPVAINDEVVKGQVLARLDTSSLEAELARPPDYELFR